MAHTKHRRAGASPAWRSHWTLIAFLAIAGFFLWTEHRPHLLGVLPYLLVLACPLMHLFHHGHGHHHGHHSESGTPEQRATGVKE